MNFLDLFTNVYGNTADITLPAFALCIFTALVLGGILANVIMHNSNCTKSFAITIALMPMCICVIVLLLSDNFGAGLAIAGAFTLIRFKSASGSAKEVASVLVAVAVGIACGTGYVAIAIITTIILGALFWIYSSCNIWNTRTDSAHRCLEICYKYTGEEDDVNGQILDIVGKHTNSIEQVMTKCDNKGEKKAVNLKYDIELKDEAEEELIKELKYSDINFDFSMSTLSHDRVKRL